MRFSNKLMLPAVISALMLCTFGPRPALAQVAASDSDTLLPVRVLGPVDDTKLVQLEGGVHPGARPEFDKGAVDSSFPMRSMVLVLKRSPQQEAVLEKFMEEQINPRSPNFHHWLAPDEFGARYGVSDYDLQAVTTWLGNHGFTIDQVSKGRIFVLFSGNAAQVKEAFHTEIHHYTVRGEQHIANNINPSIPEALSPVVVGVKSLNNFFAKPLHHYAGAVRRDGKTGEWARESTGAEAKPLYTVSGSGTPAFELVSPYDFATIYNVTPQWTAGFDGSGQVVAIAGRSDITLSDVATFRSSFGLPAKAPVVIVNGTDPGVPSEDDKVENTLDVEWSGAVAKGATIKFVTTASTDTTDGADASALYIIDNNVAPVMSFSYGECEEFYGTAGNAYNKSLWQQGAAQGISEFVASGDQGSAACDGGQQAPAAAGYGLAVSGSSSTPYNIAVGGTDFDWLNLTKTYWSSTNNSRGLSALSYIPEVPWNGTCASASVDLYYGFTAAGFDAEQTCQYELSNSFDLDFVNVVGGTGGRSSCTNYNVNTKVCSVPYPKPSWQTGTGVPADGVRDVPDVSLFAASGALNDAYAICDTQLGPCTYTNTSDAEGQAVGGTSVASPAMAGIMAIVNQKMQAPQGNANAGFYALAARDTRSSCKSTTVGSGNSCNFYDITTDNNAVPCTPSTPDCTLHHSGDEVGIINGYTSATGYDLTTGLGSVNVNNLVNNWHLVATGGSTPAVSLSPSSLTFTSTKVGSVSANQTVTVTNTGTAALNISGINAAGTNASSFYVPSRTCGSTLAAGANCTLSVGFRPKASGTLTGSISIADNAGNSPQTIAVSGTGVASPVVKFSMGTLTFPSTDVGATSASQAVTLTNTGDATLTINYLISKGTDPKSFFDPSNTCGKSVAAGASCTINIAFRPKSPGTLTDTIYVNDNAAGGEQGVNVSGTGIAEPLVTLTPSSLTFPSTTVGTTSIAQTVTLKNTGFAVLDISFFSTTGTNASSFSVPSKTCGSTLAVNASCTFNVTFKPQATGALTGNVTIHDNAVNSPQGLKVSGTGK